jgi:hypothetical protein
VTSHLRSTMPHRPTTVAEHMPSSHRRYREWTHEHIRRDAARIGPDADALIDIILRSRPYPEQASFAIWILGLVKRYGPERVDAAGARAHLLNARSYKSVAAILRSGKDKAPAATADAPILFHPNIRGRGYCNGAGDRHAHSSHRRTSVRPRSHAMTDRFIELQNNSQAAEMHRTQGRQPAPTRRRKEKGLTARPQPVKRAAVLGPVKAGYLRSHRRDRSGAPRPAVALAPRWNPLLCEALALSMSF